MSRPVRDARGEPLPVLLPDPGALFRARAARLEELAPGHAAGPWLSFLACLARGQEAAWRDAAPRRDAPALPGRTPLETFGQARDARWTAMLRAVLGAVRAPALPEPARAAAGRLGRASDAALEAGARGVLAGAPPDLAEAPFLGAALGAWFTGRAAGLRLPAPAGRAAGGCPGCGAPPLAGVIHGDERLRYLACGLCGVEWYLPRSLCSGCGSGEHVSYFSLEDGPPGAKAEACEGCGRYLKLFDRARSQRAEPVADDAATLVLDLVLARHGRGYRRAGGNPLAPAAPEKEPPCEEQP